MASKQKLETGGFAAYIALVCIVAGIGVVYHILKEEYVWASLYAIVGVLSCTFGICELLASRKDREGESEP